MARHSRSSLTSEEEKEAESLRWPVYFVRQLSNTEASQLRDRLCRDLARSLGRPNAWSRQTGKCEDELVNEAAQTAFDELCRRKVSLRNGPYPAVRCNANTLDWAGTAIDALAKYARGMTDGLERAAWAAIRAKVPRDWKVDDRGQVSEATGLKGIENDSRLIAEEHARRAQENALSKEEKKVQGVVALYHADPQVLGTLHHGSPMTDHPHVSGAVPTPFDNLATTEEESREQHEQPLKSQFVLEAHASKPRHLEMLRALLAECSSPETAGLLFKGSGRSHSLDHKRLLDVLGASWSISDIRNVWADLTVARHDSDRKKKLDENFAEFVKAQGGSQGSSIRSSDTPESKRAGVTHAAAPMKSRVKS